MGQGPGSTAPTIIKEKGQASVVELEANPLAEASIKANELGLEVCGQ